LVLLPVLGVSSTSAGSAQQGVLGHVQVGIAPTCDTVSIDRSSFLAEVVSGAMSCASVRYVLRHAHFREESGLRDWSCWRGTPAFGFTSLVYGCDGPKSRIVQSVPTTALPRIGRACRLFLGPGDRSIHSYDFRVHGVSCQTAKEVVEICKPDGPSCNAVTSAWFCRKPKQRQALGYGERCTAGKSFTSIVWLD
jgi:hypothetical protein